ncbi:MAG: PspC domain-containing protein [Patescibacteria group bacterium]|nr:PspC domain-containing protein [Patescibacteria group bacterium]
MAVKKSKKINSTENNTKEKINKINKDDQHIKRLYRSETNKILGGVCGGLAEFFDVDPTIVRIIFIFLCFFGGSGFLIYIILWIILPSYNSNNLILTNKDIQDNALEMHSKAQELTNKFNQAVQKRNSKQVFGFILIFVGVVFLLSNFGILGKIDFERIWPAILIAIGVAILFKN